MKYNTVVLILIACFGCSALHKTNINTTKGIEQLDKHLIGKRLSKALKQLQIDSNQIHAFDEPPFILRGVSITQGDSLRIELYVDRTAMPILSGKKGRVDRYALIRNKRIKGVYWCKPRSKKERITGDIIWHWHYNKPWK